MYRPIFLSVWGVIFWMGANRFFIDGMYAFWASRFIPLLILTIYISFYNKKIYLLNKDSAIWISFFTLSFLIFFTGIFSAEYEWPLKKGLAWLMAISTLFLIQPFLNNTCDIKLIIKVLLWCSVVYFFYVVYQYVTYTGVNFIQDGINKARSVEIFFVGFFSLVYFRKLNIWISLFSLPVFFAIVMLSGSLKLFISLLPLIVLLTLKNVRIWVILIPLLMYLNLDIPVIDRAFYLFGMETTEYASNDISGNLSLRNLFFDIVDGKSIIFGNGLENERIIIGTIFHSTPLSLLYGVGVVGVVLFYFPFVKKMKDSLVLHIKGFDSSYSVAGLISIFIYSLSSPLYTSPLLLFLLVIIFNLVRVAVHARTNRYK
jgi:hypothetical protein